MALNDAYLVKGFLLAKDPPQAVIDAIEAVIVSLEEAAPVEFTSSAGLEPLPLDPRTLEAIAATRAPEPPAPHPDEDGTSEEPEPPDEVAEVPEPPKVRKKHNFSPEQREAAAQRMRDMWARKRGQVPEASSPDAPTPEKPPYEIRKATPPAPTPAPAPKPKVETSIDVDRLITVHKDYAGKRDDGLLVDGDWPDVKARLARGDTRAAIASDYDVELEDLDFFIASNQRREAKQPPGEALASPSSGASGAARQTW